MDCTGTVVFAPKYSSLSTSKHGPGDGWAGAGARGCLWGDTHLKPRKLGLTLLRNRGNIQHPTFTKASPHQDHLLTFTPLKNILQAMLCSLSDLWALSSFSTATFVSPSASSSCLSTWPCRDLGYITGHGFAACFSLPLSLCTKIPQVFSNSSESPDFISL